MASEQLKQNIYAALKQDYFSDPDDTVDISGGPEDSIHLVLFSRQFAQRSRQENHDLIWAELQRTLASDEWKKGSLLVGASPEAIKAT